MRLQHRINDGKGWTSSFVDKREEQCIDLPPIPPNPLTNCAPSCDLSVMISSVAPARQQSQLYCNVSTPPELTDQNR